MATGFKMDLSDLLSGLAQVESKIDAAIQKYAEDSAVLLEDSAKENRRWTDRTGEARRRLNCSVSLVAKGRKLILAHGVSYGLWLELANEKKYSIIPETIEHVGTFEIMPGFEDLLNKLR